MPSPAIRLLSRLSMICMATSVRQIKHSCSLACNIRWYPSPLNTVQMPQVNTTQDTTSERSNQSPVYAHQNKAEVTHQESRCRPMRRPSCLSKHQCILQCCTMVITLCHGAFSTNLSSHMLQNLTGGLGYPHLIRSLAYPICSEQQRGGGGDPL